MATWTDDTKNTSTVTNDQKSGGDLTWDEATFTWDDAEGTWDVPFAYENDTKNISTFTNDTKN